MNEYDKQASDFLAKTNTTITSKYIGFQKHFDNDEHKRFVYEVTLSKGSRAYTFKYGGSIKDVEDHIRNTSYSYQGYTAKLFNYPIKVVADKEILKAFEANKVITRPKLPSNYDILACLTILHDDSFEDFCSNFGYDEDSRQAERVYKAVLEESNNLKMLFSDVELEELQEIN